MSGKNVIDNLSVKLIPKSIINNKNDVLQHKCKCCNRWISIKVDKCVWCDAKHLKAVYGIG